MRTHYRIGIAVAAGALAAGCGAPTGSSASAPPLSPSAPSPSFSASPSIEVSSSVAPLPTITKTAKPPKQPTDTLPENGWVTGMVTKGGTGPCYGLSTDEGTVYALYSTDGIKLEDGARVKVKLEPSLLKIYCGPGELMTMLEAKPIG